MSRQNSVLDRGIDKHLHGEDAPLFDQRGEPAIPPTRNMVDKLGTPSQLARVAAHLAAAYRIVPKIEELQAKGLVQQSLVTAGRHYAVLHYMAHGPSQGISRYGDYQPGAPSWARMITSDERIKASQLFERARLAGFGTRNRYNEWEIDELLCHAVEPVILGEARAWSAGQIGKELSGYASRNGVNAAGVTEIVGVLRRLRIFFVISG